MNPLVQNRVWILMLCVGTGWYCQLGEAGDSLHTQRVPRGSVNHREPDTEAASVFRQGERQERAEVRRLQKALDQAERQAVRDQANLRTVQESLDSTSAELAILRAAHKENQGSLRRTNRENGRLERLLAALQRDHKMALARIVILEESLAEERGQWEQEKRVYQRIYTDEQSIRNGTVMREHIRDANDLALAWSLNDVALLMVQEGGVANAEPLYRRALFILEQSLAGDHPARGTVTQHLADLHWQRGDLGTASALYENAATIFESALGPNHPRLAAALNGWGTLLRDQGRTADAIGLYRRAIQIYESANLGTELDLVVPLYNLGWILRRNGDHGCAEVAWKRAALIQDRHPHVPAGHRALLWQALAEVYRQKGDLAGARMYEERLQAITMEGWMME